ncbi:uncharacterized protein FA14DRAFT_54739 [Meira miltonrushii]|uniref:DASH complex subunit ASK1 n=1 Tax=Meira miltonrushii TaxID=1280837 RepID=A0A316VFN0_9BASI|nr:uncharacterized protein FA14DRAFT_54739 [Meira miltonrushii]PWN36392.1 hypothetical protein FA14DRAFT_54739 [Meira miltonrushii]
MQSHHRPSHLSRPSGFPGSSNAGPSSLGQVSDLPTHLPSGEPIPIGDQLMQVDQAITLTLQEIDANFAKTHQTITGRILPMIKRYGVASHNTWQGAKFWHKFFEAASDIHLAPPREQSTFDSTAEGEEVEGERHAEERDEQTFDRDDQSMQSFQGTTPRGRQAAENDSYDIQDDSGELRHSHFEPPRVSDASMAATARLSRTGLGASQSGRNLERMMYDEDESADFDQIGDVDIDPDSTKTARGGSKADTIRATSSKPPKVQATPRRDSAKKNPFAKGVRPPPPQQQASTSSSDTDAAKRSNSPRWNGIADLRKTPLSHINRSPVRKGAKAGKGKSSTNIDEDDEDSLAWPAGMSPPVTMQFSVPRSRYNKTPAKEAAKLVVDDLLRTVEGTTPAARRRLMQERQGGREDAPVGVRSRAIERVEVNVAGNNVVGTPLGTGKRRPNKGRTSMPTPPTVTKRVGGTIRASTSTQKESTPKSMSNKVPSTASRLMDEDEEGQSLANDEVPEDLGTGLSKLAITRPGAADGMDKLFEGDEDDSDNDMEDTDSEDEEDEYEGSAISSVRAPGAFPMNNASHTSSSIASVSHSIDEDTLFGIRDPSFGPKVHKGGPSQTPAVSNASRTGSASISGQGKTTNRPLPHQSATASHVAATPSNNSYRPMGQVANLGTVYRGRPLLGEERDDTYSAPSPTPAAYSGGRPPGR